MSARVMRIERSASCFMSLAAASSAMNALMASAVAELLVENVESSFFSFTDSSLRASSGVSSGSIVLTLSSSISFSYLSSVTSSRNFSSDFVSATT